MTRKDTIMIAVLINAVLLVTLFFTAIKSEKIENIPIAKEKLEEVLPSKVISKEIMVARGDEIDQVLKEFSQKRPEKIDFVKELEASVQASALASEQKTKNCVEVTVKKGDVLEKIARAHQSSVQEIMQENHLNTTNLQIGQVLKIPAKKIATKAKAVEEKYYLVKQGDNPWSIAVKNHIKVEDLLKLNGLNEEKARRLRPGDKLRIQ